MKIDFKQEVLKRKDDILRDTIALLKINSELTTYDPKSKTPFGPGINEALEYMLNLGKKDGFNVLNADGFAGHIELGNEDDYIGMIGHLDVVPAGSGWTYPAYGAEIHDGKLYARGAEDDKGPTMAAYYAMKIVKELELPLSKRIKLILGTDEETGWRGVKHYFNNFPEQPIFGFIPDAEFPLTYAEKGILRLSIKDQVEPEGLLKFNAGLRDNMVPESATAVLENVSLIEDFSEFLDSNNYHGTAEVIDNQLHLMIEGKSAHGSTPDEGVNAAFLMVDFFNEVGLNNQFIDLINLYLLDDYDGVKIGADHEDEETGKVTINAGVFNYDNGTYEITLNPRYPNGVEPDDFINRFKLAFESLGATVELRSHQKRLYVNPKDTLVTTLLDIYKKHSGDVNAQPLTTGGGTFARAMKNSVAFGPHFPGKPSYIHQKNEYIEVEDLLIATAIYAEALYELAK
ncbi:MAG: dipeptidase PepV [Acholeplasmataceae bacterium]|jgi:succinyl-diaminopimelate desuccinylase|nr:dipeptidase PepV [Acholeplasmataceae bacterium]MDD4203516.1 dipeptidase PepV [Acholeplasmataceae bacterium]